MERETQKKLSYLFGDKACQSERYYVEILKMSDVNKKHLNGLTKTLNHALEKLDEIINKLDKK